MGQKDVKKFVRDLQNAAKKISSGNETYFVAAFMAFMLRENRNYNRFLLPYDAFEPPKDAPQDVVAAAKNFNIAPVWQEFQDSFSEYFCEDYENAIHFIGENYSKSVSAPATPKSVSDLAIALLDVKSNDCVIDIGSGCGNFLTQASVKRDVELCGIEKDSYAHLISLLRLYVSGVRNFEKIISDDAFKWHLPGFDKGGRLGRAYRVYKNPRKIFANYPFAARAKALGDNATKFAWELKRQLGLSQDIYSADWMYNGLACIMMGFPGMAVTVMGAGSAWKQNDAIVRETFVKKNLIDAVIELPPKILPGTAADLCMIVFKPSSKGVKLIDARSEGIIGRRETVLNEVMIDRIMDLYKNTEPTTAEDLKEANYCLIASRFEAEKNAIGTNVENMPPKKGYATRVLGNFCQLKRGAMISSEELDEALCKKSVGFRYMVPSNIVNGEVAQNLPFIDPYLLKRRVNLNLYCAKPQNIVMTKNGFPCRLAVIPKDSQDTAPDRILVNNNLFIINVDGTVADSEYVKLFLESSRGQSLIKNSMVGGNVQTIDQKAFLNIAIPLPSLDMQKAFIKKHNATQAQVKKIRQQLEEALNKASKELDQEMG